MSELRISAVQFSLRPVRSFEEFSKDVTNLVDKCPPSDFVVFPELFTYGLVASTSRKTRFESKDLALISRYTDHYFRLFRDLSMKKGSVIIAGSHLRREGKELLNTSHIFYPDGSSYRHAKTHIFPPEREYGTSEGNELEVLEWKGVRFGVLICYEMEIPECATTLVSKGAEIIFCPSMTLSEHGFWRVRHCCHARSIENQIFVVHCCIVGKLEHPPVNCWGSSSILSPCDSPWKPNGVMKEATPNKPSILHGSVVMDDLYANRKTGAAPTFNDRKRRKELYDRYLVMRTDSAKMA